MEAIKLGCSNTWERIIRDVRDYKMAILIFAAYYIVVHMLFHAFCPMVMITGFPCAGCGMTRAVFFAVTGQFARSWQLNPMALPLLIFVIYCIVIRYFLGRKIKGFKAGVAILITGMLAAYVYRMLTIFPNRPPYTYNPGNFLEKSLPFYRETLHRLLGI